MLGEGKSLTAFYDDGPEGHTYPEG